MPPLNLDQDPPYETPPTGVRWLVFGLACATSFCLYLHRYTWNFVAPELQARHGWSEGDVQQAYTLFNITYGLGQIPSGVLIDRHGPRLFLTLIIALWSLIIPLQAAGTWLAVAVARLGLGATQAGCYPALAQVTARWFPLAYRTRIQGLVATVCGRAGGALAPILMTSVLMGTLDLSLSVTLWVLTATGLLL
ncbi:MAG: MFS transporter, partial [Planctomycetaceae bacterium]